MEIIVNPFYKIKDIIKTVDVQSFPLKRLVEQYKDLGKEKWKDLELTSYFLDTALDILDIKMKFFFAQNANELEVFEEEKKVALESNWQEIKRYLEVQEEKGIRVFWRRRKKEFYLKEDEKINITQVYLSWKYKNKFLLNNFSLPKDELNLEEKINKIINYDKIRFSFRELTYGLKKREIVYYFLAVCQLVSEGKLKVYQDKFCGDIVLEKILEHARL